MKSAPTYTYAIGDAQGCCARVAELIENIDAIAPDSRLLFVGDLVNRGPQSLETLRVIRALGDRARVVLGNHDLHLLAVAHGLRKSHRSDTLDAILAAPDRIDLLDWLRTRPLALMENGHLVVHAGVVPQWTASRTIALAQEVEAALAGPDWVEFLRHMYGNTPDRWDDSLHGIDRLRCIVNVLTRIRLCDASGTMDFAPVESAAAPDGWMPWFDAPGRRTENDIVVFGHWSKLGLTVRPNLIGLDTGCVWGGKLSAVCLEDRSVLQVACPQYQQPAQSLGSL